MKYRELQKLNERIWVSIVHAAIALKVYTLNRVKL